MRNNRFQNHVSKSTLTLPLCMVTGALAWFWNGTTQEFSFSNLALASFLLAAVCTYIVIETSNFFALLRIRSSMIAAVWVVCISMLPALHSFSMGWVAVTALAASYYTMFLAYQQHEPVLHIFHSFLLLGIASLAIPHVVVFITLYYWYLLVFLRCLTWRGFWAGTVGMALPACFALGWCILSRDFGFIQGRLELLQATRLLPADGYAWLMSCREPQALNFTFITLLSVIGIVHYLRTYYNDKIRTRMYLYIYVMQTVASWLLMVCLPDLYYLVYPVFLLGASTMIAHFFALTGTIVSNLLFCLCLILALMLFTLNMGLWTF